MKPFHIKQPNPSCRRSLWSDLYAGTINRGLIMDKRRFPFSVDGSHPFLFCESTRTWRVLFGDNQLLLFLVLYSQIHSRSNPTEKRLKAVLWWPGHPSTIWMPPERYFGRSFSPFQIFQSENWQSTWCTVGSALSGIRTESAVGDRLPCNNPKAAPDWLPTVQDQDSLSWATFHQDLSNSNPV